MARFTKKGESVIRAIKRRNKRVTKSKRVNPFAVATARGLRKKNK